MPVEITRSQARQVRQQLLNSPVAPGIYSHFINAGTDQLLNVLEKQYFQSDLAEGISCFKYLEGDYGTGKTQFIHSLAQTANNNNIVTAIVNIGQECPFNSPKAIFKSIMCSFLPPKPGDNPFPEKGIEVLILEWIQQKLQEMGSGDGGNVPDAVRREIERLLGGLWTGAPDQQMASALAGLGRRLLAIECGSNHTVVDQELISWLRGDAVKSKALKDQFGLYESVRDETAFRRLKTVIGFLRKRMGYQGFFVAFDEGYRTSSFRRGSVAQRQAIENMLTMINENAEGQFAGVMFLYSATPDLRNDVISRTYQALNDRIGTVAWLPGCPVTPLIVLDEYNKPEIMVQIGERLLDVFAKAGSFSWDQSIQKDNLDTIIEAEINRWAPLRVPIRNFVYHYCHFLVQQENSQNIVAPEDALAFVEGQRVPEREDN